MSPNADDPQIGTLDVDADALEGAGERLSEVLDRLGAELEDGMDSDAPADGWRVLRREQSGRVTVGAPTDASAKAWRIAQVEADREGMHRPRASMHPETMPLRPSRAERAAGLALRWPPLSADEAQEGVFVIDIVNRDDSRWRPDGDPFFVTGVITSPGAEGARGLFAFAGGQNAAVPLDPDEYARVHVSISDAQWERLRAGRYELHAMLVTLPVRSTSPLSFDLTQEQIDKRRALRESRSRTAAEVAESQAQHVRHQKALIDGASRLEEISRLITDAATDQEARAAVEALLHIDGGTAWDVIHTPLSQFTKGAVHRARANVRGFE